MRRFLVSLAAASTALVVAAPAASAQSAYGVSQLQRGYGGYGYQNNRGQVQRFNAHLAQLEQRIQRSAQRGAITRSEYRALREHARELRTRLYRFSRDGLSRGEIQDIADRIDNLQDRIRDERRDGRRDGRRW